MNTEQASPDGVAESSSYKQWLNDSLRMGSLLQVLIQNALMPDADDYEPWLGGNLPATVQLADLLALSWRNISMYGYADKLDYFRQHIPDALLKERLTKAEQVEIVDAMLTQLQETPNRRDLLWVISKAPPDVALARLFDFIAQSGERLENDPAFQAVIALQNMISYQPTENEKQELLTIPGLLETGRFVWRCTTSDDARLKEQADSLADVLSRYGIVG